MSNVAKHAGLEPTRAPSPAGSDPRVIPRAAGGGRVPGRGERNVKRRIYRHEPGDRPGGPPLSIGAFPMDASVQPSQSTSTQPTIVLVHGAFADASSWNGVVERLQRQGCNVVAPPNPLRGITADADYIASALHQIDGPVLLVGHSYGGAVITNAATTASNVVGLVYVCAFAPDEGELLINIENGSTGSGLQSALVQVQYPAGQGGG